MPPFFYSMTMRNDEWSQIFTDLRKETGLTQKMASEQAGMSAHYVARIECGNYSPSVRNLDKVLNVYGYELEVGKK